MNNWHDKDVIQYYQCQREHGRNPDYIQRIRQGNETPFSGVQAEGVTNDYAEGDKVRQDSQQQRQTIEERIAFEAKIKAAEQRGCRRQRVVRGYQQVARGQSWKTHES